MIYFGFNQNSKNGLLKRIQLAIRYYLESIFAVIAELGLQMPN